MEHDFTKPVVTIDTVPQDFRSMYKQGQDGQFVVDDAHKTVVNAVVALNTSLKAAREDAKRAGTKAVDLTPLSEFGASPAEIKEAFDKRVADLVTKGGDAAKAVEKVRAEMSDAHKKAMDASNSRTQLLETQLHSYIIDGTANAAIAEERGIPELLLPFIKQQVKVVEENGTFAAHVVDAKGERRYSGVTGQPMTIKDLVAEMKGNAKYGRLFESQQSGGGGAQSQQQTGAPRQPGQAKTSHDKIAGALKSPKYRT